MMSNQTMRVIRLVDHNAQFHLSSTKAGIEPFILNTIDLSDPNYMEQLSESVFSDGESGDFIAKCQCGDTVGNNRAGTICNMCDTVVSVGNLLDEDNLVCKNWLACPHELPNGWIMPKMYLNLSTWLSYGKDKKNYLDDILNVETPIPVDIMDVVKGKGFAYLHDNFDRIMDYFIHDHPVIRNKPDTLPMKHCIQLYRDRIWCHYIPILNTAINPIVSDDRTAFPKKRYSDTTADHILQAAISLSNLEFSPRKRNRAFHVEKTTYKAYKDIIAYTEDATKKYISVKKAIPRTHIFGSRFHWSFRSVIVPIVQKHYVHELHIPWKMAVNTLRVHILGVLGREYGLTINQALSKVRRALQVIDEDIRIIMNKFIEDSPFPGIPCLWDRPPSIRDGSVTLKYVTVIKTDLNDSSVGMSSIDVALANA